jgi:hypothetical protein
MVKMMKKLADYHQAKLDAIPEDATEESLLSENANDRYIVDMWTISRATGVKVTPMVYYSSLYPYGQKRRHQLFLVSAHQIS